MDTAYKKALDILSENIDSLHKTTDMLMEKEKVTGAQFRELFPEGKLLNKERDNKTMFVGSGNVVAPEESIGRDPSEELKDLL